MALASDARGSEMPLRGAKASEMEAIASIVNHHTARRARPIEASPAWNRQRRGDRDLRAVSDAILFFQRCEVQP